MHRGMNEAVLAAEHRWVAAVETGDIKGLDKLFEPELIVISGSGKVENKKIELDENVLEPGQRYEFFDTDDVKIRLLDNAAVVTCRCFWRLHNSDGTVEEEERRYMNIWVRHKHEWRLLAQQMTRILK